VILLSHPTGNRNVRALLAGLEQAGKLASFQTTLAVQQVNRWYFSLVPPALRQQLLRRSYDLPESTIALRPLRELVRLMAPKLRANFLVAYESGWASVDSVYQDLDRHVANQLKFQFNLQRDSVKHQISGVYCYEDAALQTFRAAKEIGLKCFYDLPIAYWETSQQLLHHEVERFPEWKRTLAGIRNSPTKLERKTAELALADVVICPSKFVYNSLPATIRQPKKSIVAEFGSPIHQIHSQKSQNSKLPLRVLFVGSMSQRKGLADLFSAMKLLHRPDVELVVMGSPVVEMDFYHQQLSNFIYEPTRPHQAVLKLMQSCDVFVLPSIVEGRALVQQEAMSCGLPLIVTPNAGGEDLIEEGRTGFLVPIRSPEKIAEKIAWFADHRDKIAEMGQLAREKAAQVTWETYCQKILGAIAMVL